MELYPAIDLKDHNVVRLTQGDYGRMTVYAEDPVKTAQNFAACGATNLHVVDLDGAKDGTLANFDTIQRILDATDLFVEVGGGIRDEARIRKYLEAGVSRVILGTMVVEDPAFVARMLGKYGNQIAVGVDTKDGLVATHGWQTVSSIKGVDFCRKMRKHGLSTVIYTDIAKDGAMSGTNLSLYQELSTIEGLDIIASGGISYYEELSALAALDLYGAILGKSLYTGAIDLKKALELTRR